jgi:hypothetical protein
MQFDAPPGLYRLSASTASPKCADDRFVYFMPSYERHISMALSSQPTDVPRPIYLFAGVVPPIDGPTVHPSPVLLDRDAQCDEPVRNPMPVRALTEYEAGSYYITLYGEPNVRPGSQTLTFDVQIPQDTHHFVYIPMPFPIALPSDGWPVIFRLDMPPLLFSALDERTADWMVCWNFDISSSK